MRVYQDPKAPMLAGRRRWCIDYTDLNGKRCRMRTIATTKAEAEEMLRVKLNELAKAKIAGVQSVQELRVTTLEEFVRKEYLPACEPPRNRPGTYARKLGLATHVLRHLGGISLRALGPGDIERFMTRRMKESTYKETPPSPAEINRERSFLCAALNMALRRGMIERNPVPAVRRLREDNERDRTLTRTEEEQVLGQSANWLRPMIVIALNTGMREGEIVGLKWGDADLEKGFIRVSHASKSHKVRHVPINAAVREILDRSSAQAETVGEFVFVNTRKGVPYRADSVYHAFKRAALRAGIDNVVFHTLRHTCVSRLVQAGVPDRKIMKMVGHSSPHMVSRYTHLAPDSLKGVADVLMDGGAIGSRHDSDRAAKPSPIHRGRRRAKEQHGNPPEPPGSSSVA